MNFCRTALLFALLGLVRLVHGQEAEASGDSPPLFTQSSQLIDLTHPFDASTIYWPTEDGFKLTVDQYGVTERGYFYSSKRFAAAEHGGTHLDAPIHFSEQGQTVDELPLERFVGNAAVIDVTAACAADRDYQVGIDDLRGWEAQHQRQLIDVIVLLNTGFGRYWEEPERYLGTSRTGREAVPLLHFPGLAPEAAEWLAEHRNVKAVGIDTASIDYGQSRRFQSHVTLFQHNIPVFENVAHLNRLPGHGATVIALPMKIATGTGAPLRIIAHISKP